MNKTVVVGKNEKKKKKENFVFFYKQFQNNYKVLFVICIFFFVFVYLSFYCLLLFTISNQKYNKTEAPQRGAGDDGVRICLNVL